jgi:hypothetical protein
MVSAIPPIVTEYEQLEKLAQKMYDALTEACETEKRDPDHLFDLTRMRRIARMDGARCAFAEWMKS